MVMADFIERVLRERRSLEKAFADMLAEYEHRPTPELAERIKIIDAEIARRRGQKLATAALSRRS
jgi:hypothetical protein